MSTKNKWYLGKTKGPRSESVFLEDFSWDCGWYWSGGYIGNNNFHAHFDGAFLEVPDIRGHCLGNFVTPWTNLKDYQKGARILSNGAAVWEPLSTFLDNAQYTENEWWRIKDLFKQFYRLRDAAEVFQHGGHCTSAGRNPAELNKDMAKSINKHIETVIIPEIRKALDRVEWKAAQELKHAKEAELQHGANI
jgi:hypothetical protein